MNRQQEIEIDLKLASLSKKVIYLEGKTDPEIFFALLGISTPKDGLHRGVLVKGLSEKTGSGSTAVTEILNVAARNQIRGIFGLIDGDGKGYQDLASAFDKPHPGPLFRWKAYCIENLLAKTGWPLTWNLPIDWEFELSRYAPYMALNRIQQEVQSNLRVLGLARMSRPDLARPLKIVDEVLVDLENARHLLDGYDVSQRFRDEIASFEAVMRVNLDEIHALLNGKWIIEHLAPSKTGQPLDECRTGWIAHAISVGGLAEVRAWWERVTGAPP